MALLRKGLVRGGPHRFQSICNLRFERLKGQSTGVEAPGGFRRWAYFSEFHATARWRVASSWRRQVRKADRVSSALVRSSATWSAWYGHGEFLGWLGGHLDGHTWHPRKDLVTTNGQPLRTQASVVTNEVCVDLLEDAESFFIIAKKRKHNNITIYIVNIMIYRSR